MLVDCITNQDSVSEDVQRLTAKMLNFAKNMKNMRFHVIFLVAALLSLEACHDANTVFGTWRADKVNVEFDEDKTTPDMIQQVGEMEKNNVIVIAEDSTMTFYSEDD